MPSKGRVAAFYGVPGVGSTTLLSNIAAIACRTYASNVAILDLTEPRGDVAVRFNLDITPGPVSLCNASERVENIRSRFHRAHTRDIQVIFNYRESAVEDCLWPLREEFRLVLIDLTGQPEDVAFRIAGSATRLCIVVSEDAARIRQSGILLDRVRGADNTGLHKKLLLIANETSSVKTQFSPYHIQEFLKQGFHHHVNYCKHVAESANSGYPFLLNTHSQGSGYHFDVSPIAAKLLGVKPKSPTPNLPDPQANVMALKRAKAG